MSLKLALIADVHGNVLALDAALADIESHAVDRIVVLGDLAQNGPRPSETVASVMELEAAGAVVIAGNTDIAVADGDYATLATTDGASLGPARKRAEQAGKLAE